MMLKLTLTFPYFQVKRTTAGRQAMTQHSNISMAVLMSQFKDTTQGEPSTQDSQPSAQGRHSKESSTAYWLSSPWKRLYVSLERIIIYLLCWQGSREFDGFHVIRYVGNLRVNFCRVCRCIILTGSSKTFPWTIHLVTSSNPLLIRLFTKTDES